MAKKWMFMGGLFITGIVIGLLFWFQFFKASASRPLAPPFPVLPESDAVQRAVTAAAFCGLRGTPSASKAQQMTLGEFASIAGWGEPGPDAAKVGLDPAKPVWVVSMLGNVLWSCPGGSQTLTNMVVVLDAKTGETIARGGLPSGHSLLPVLLP